MASTRLNYEVILGSWWILPYSVNSEQWTVNNQDPLSPLLKVCDKGE
jgi:hypothetical protein